METDSKNFVSFYFSMHGACRDIIIYIMHIVSIYTLFQKT